MTTQTVEMLKIGTRVAIKAKGLMPGRIRGYGFDGTVLKYLVDLETGLWTEDKSVFVSILVVDPSNLEVIPEFPRARNVKPFVVSFIDDLEEPINLNEPADHL